MKQPSGLGLFAGRYPRDITMPDATRVRVRPVCVRDKEALQSVLSHLSVESRRRRFFYDLTELSPRLLKDFTEIDYVNQFALSAWALDREPECVAVGRYVRDPCEPRVAEPALAVIDAYQGRGLGTLILRQLMAEARFRKISCFRGAVFRNNEPAKHLIAAHGARFTGKHLNNVITEFELATV